MSSVHLVPAYSNRVYNWGTGKKELGSRITRDSPVSNNFYANRSRKAGSVSGLSFGDDPSYDDAFPSGMRIENTYQLHPTVIFPVSVVHDVIEDVLKSYLTNEMYQEELCREMAKTLSEVVKARIRELQIPRYRFICRVDIGQMGRQGVSISSNFLWDATTDNFCTCEFKNNSLFAVCTVFAIYTE